MQLLNECANTLRFLSADMVQKANSGHPGAPMGLSEIITILSQNLNHNPKNPKWLNRDRLIFSGGHASALIYSFLHLSGYDISLQDLQNFRQFQSKTPGHPEYGEVPGVEITTGPLGQGIANAVGFAMATKLAKNMLNEEKNEIINHKVYCICGDGDLQEGISYEACSLGGALKLSDLILIYDSNNITIEGSTSLAWNEDVKIRFEAQGWVVFRIDGHDKEQIQAVLNEVKNQTKPSLIIANTTIAKGSVSFEGSADSHGSPLGKEEIINSKKNANFPTQEFYIQKEVKQEFEKALLRGQESEEQWNESLKHISQEKKDLLNNLLNPNFSSIKYPTFEPDTQVATRDSNGLIINEIAKQILGFVGGSADLAPSNKSELKNQGHFPNGKNIHFGIREHSMAAIMNAFSLYGLFLPFSATFFVFSDYLKPSARIAALMKTKVFYIWTHDSIGVGEDGPTHQPIEQLSQFRAMPNFYVFRPADASENVQCWQIALNLQAPSAFVLSRQKLQTLKEKFDGGDIKKGGYLLKKREGAKITLISSGSEVMLCLKAVCELEEEGILANVVSVPCFDLLNEQDKNYIQSIILKDTLKIAVEASRGLEWYKFADIVWGIDSFGASGKAEVLFEHFGLEHEKLKQKIRDLKI